MALQYSPWPARGRQVQKKMPRSHLKCKMPEETPRTCRGDTSHMPRRHLGKYLFFTTYYVLQTTYYFHISSFSPYDFLYLSATSEIVNRCVCVPCVSTA